MKELKKNSQRMHIIEGLVGTLIIALPQLTESIPAHYYGYVMVGLMMVRSVLVSIKQEKSGD